jgi:hypothetical protein
MYGGSGGNTQLRQHDGCRRRVAVSLQRRQLRLDLRRAPRLPTHMRQILFMNNTNMVAMTANREKGSYSRGGR